MITSLNGLTDDEFLEGIKLKYELKKVETALADLEFSHKRISGEVKKVLQSAIANAENNHGLDIDSLIVSEAYVGKNLVMKRFRARARGRGAKILKPFSELTIVVREVEEVSADNNSEAA